MIPLGDLRPPVLLREASAGLLVSVAAVPLSIGLAQVAGVPPAVGLVTCVWPLVAFALLGASPHLKLGMDAGSAAIIAATVPPLVASSPDRYVAVAAALTLLTGAVILAAGVLRLGVLADLLSLPVLVGYTAGIAASVIISQLPRMLGYSASGDNSLEEAVDIARNLGAAHLATVAVAVASLLALLVLRRVVPVIPAGALVLVVGITLSWMLDLSDRDVATVGALPSGLPVPGLPSVGSSDLVALIGPAFGVALVIASDTIITSRSFAVRLHQQVDANRDLVGLGAANLASAVTGGVIASASYGRTAVAERSGSRSQLSGVFAAGFMAVVLLALTGVLALTPVALLAAIVVDAVARLVDPRAFLRIARVRRLEVFIAVLTLVGVLTVGLLATIFASVGAALLLAFADLVRAWRVGSEHAPHPRLGRFSVIGREPRAVRCAWHGPIVFTNASRFRRSLVALLAEPGTIDDIALDARDVTMLDATAADMLAELESALRARQVHLSVDHLDPVFAERVAASRTEKGVMS